MNRHSTQKTSFSRRRTLGFTLLEVMVAIAVLALGTGLMVQIQARSLEMAQEARAITIATQLARGKLLDCEYDVRKKGFGGISDYKENGKFDDEGQPDFFWECYAYQPDLPIPDGGEISAGALGVSDEQSSANSGMQAMGVGMISPVLSQLGEVLKQSLKELVVVIRWKDGKYWEEMRVVTHISDMAAMRQVAQMLNRQAQQMTKMFGGGK
ncbi:MAG: prepilin-type N-terminal cleavage/methylation domain-containing protein [Deltaproteobacteria bacterium]|nr:prepilin-type N-terminal cleavage/methylation domain-containing protein [Deltaproteobacteria bacterium]